MYVVVGGAGEVGFHVAKALRDEGHDVAVIEPDEDRMERLADLDVLAIQGNCASRDNLLEAGIETADLFIGVSGDDEVNMVAAALAKAHDCRTVARINDTDYLQEPYSDRYADMGIDVAVCPELVAAIRISRLLTQPSLLASDVFGQGRVLIAEGRVADNAFVVGKQVKDIEPPAGFNLVAIYREDDVVIPRGTTRFLPRDRLLMAVTSMDVVKEVEPYIGKTHSFDPGREVRRIMIGGATRVGIHLARMLETRRDVLLMERNLPRCTKASEQLQRALVVHGDMTDRHLLIQENVDTFDAFIGCHNAEEYNVLGALIARRLGVPVTVAMIQQPELKPMVEELGVDLAVSPRLSTVGAIMRCVHADAENLQLMHKGDAQVLELKVGANSKAAGKTLEKLHLPHDAIVAAVVRDGEVLIPRGGQTLEAGDLAVIFTMTHAAGAVERLF